MPSASALRLQIETALQTRIPGALTPRPRTVRELVPTSVPELDALLEGGLPVGAISEFVGPQSSGRTSLAMATLAEMTQAGKTVAWVDTSDALDPESAAAAGVVLSRQLWVRCGQNPGVAAQVASPPASTGAGAPLLVEGSHAPASGGGCGSPHPRGEARGLSDAVNAFLQPGTFARTLPPYSSPNQRKDRSIGTPGAPNRKLLGHVLDRTPQDARPFPRRARDREEQIPTDRQPTRRQVLYQQQQIRQNAAGCLQAAQIANTAEAAQNRPQAGHWTDNGNNAHGRALHTPPNAIAAGLPRFRDMEARAAGQGHNAEQKPFSWNPSITDLHLGPCTEPARCAQPATAMANPGDVAPERPHLLPMSNRTNRPDTEAALLHGNRGASLAGDRPRNLNKVTSPFWHALDQALRATDLLLAAGGFSALVLDLGCIPPEFAWRIPLATWFRFRAAADRARTVLLVLTQLPCARSSAELVLRFVPLQPQAAATVVTGALFSVHLDRRRFETPPAPVLGAPATSHTLHLVTARKQPQRQAFWHRSAAWSSATRTGTEPRTGPEESRP